MTMPTLADVFNLSKQYFKVFVEEIVGLDNADFQNELDDQLTDESIKKIAVAFPRGHGKSTHISIAFPLWLISKNHNLRILIISSTGSISKSFMTEIIGHIEKNDKYKAYTRIVDPKGTGVVPKMKNYSSAQQNWSGDSILIDRDQLTLKDPTINAVGLFGSILSKRADIIICDDIVNQENSNTEEQRLKIIDWIYTTVLPVLVPGGRFIYLGNTWHQDDLVSRLLKDPQFDYKKRLPAILHEPNKPELWHEWGKLLLDESMSLVARRTKAKEYYEAHLSDMEDGVQILWPERFKYKDLYLIRLANPYSFARMYQCDPSNRPDQKFKDEWLELATRKGKSLKLQDEERLGLVMEITTSGLDLAISQKSSADDTALLTLDRVKWVDTKIHPDIRPGDYIPRNIDRGKKTPAVVRDMVRDHSNSVRPNGIRVESVAYQESMVRDLAEMGIAGIHGYHTGGEKFDPDIGVNSLAIVAEMGKLVLPFDQTDPRTILLTSQLMNEMRAFPDGHTGDSLMALWFAYSEMRDLAGDRIIIPINEALKEAADLSNPEVLKKGEEEADLARKLESEYERSNFNRIMGSFR